MRIHFIAVGGSAMHSLALEMKNHGHEVSGSDDVLFDPAKTALEKAGIAPKTLGWNPEQITNSIDVVVLGMHAKGDNPELKRAQELSLRINSYPEFLAGLSEDKTRVVVAGSHGKTTITAMVLHVLGYHNQIPDFMVGAPVPAVSKTLSLQEENDFILLEGDEYLSSAIDQRPKFLWYTPEIALISGIAWDHVNVFPSFETYTAQFENFIYSLQEGGVLIYNEEDRRVKSLVENASHPIKKIPYQTPKYSIDQGVTYLETEEGNVPLHIFGKHNLSNLAGAKWICQLMGIDASDFYEALPSFKGAAKRLECIAQGSTSLLFKDFAHAPSKVKATTEAIRAQFPSKKIIACLELHTYSSLDPAFLVQYQNTLQQTDASVVFYDPEALKIKNRTPIAPDQIRKAFGQAQLQVVTQKEGLEDFIFNQNPTDTVFLMMSSGNFGGFNWERLKAEVNAS